MKKDDLTQLKHVGAARMKLLNDSGINTIEQLHETPLNKLVEIKSIGEHYAKLIKQSVSEHYGEKKDKGTDKPASDKKAKSRKIDRELRNKTKRVKKNLDRVNEKLKPLWKKKYLKSYVGFKQKSTKLKARLKGIDSITGDLSKKKKKRIIKNADALVTQLKKVDKKSKKKRYQRTTEAVQSFSRLLRDMAS